MISSFKSTRPLGEVAKVISGYAFKSAEFGREGIPVIKIKNIRVGSVDLGDAACVDERFLNLDSKYHVNPGDLLISLTGSHPNQPNSVVGRVARMGSHQSRCLLNQRAGKIYLRKGAAGDLGYLYYILSSPEFRNAVAMLANGAASQANVSPTQVESLEIPLPDLPTQRKIAGILSAYDDLIENNLRRIKILEQMAQSLYGEWFVHFRFPGHESAKFVGSSLGQIPKGWGITDLEKVTSKIGSGATPRGGKDSYQTDGIALIRSMNIYDYSFEFDNLAFIDPKQAAQLDNVSVEAQDVLLNITGASVCRCAIVPSYLLPARVNQHVAIIRADTQLMDPHFLLDSINSEQNKRTLFSLAQGGATREALTKETICRFQILQPPRELVFRYGRIAGALHTQRENLQRKNQTLRSTRNLLLPKLLAGTP